MSDRALILIAHGSPDPDWRRPLEAIRDRVAATTGGPVYLAYLAQAPRLDEVVEQARDAGHTAIEVVAALLSPGGKHVKRDIPEAVAAARARFPELDLALRPGTVGDDPGVLDAIAEAVARGIQR